MGLLHARKKVANPRINMEHIFHVEINRKGQATGFHHEGSIGHKSKNYEYYSETESTWGICRKC